MGVGHHHHHHHHHARLPNAAPAHAPDMHLSAHQGGDSEYRHHAHSTGARPLIIAVLLTASYALVELVGGWWSGSLALIADAGHMATDAAALIVALIANIIARQPLAAISNRHSFGLARVEVIAGFINALAMLAIVAWIFFEAINRIRTPVVVSGGEVFLIAAVGLVINCLVAWQLSHGHDNLNTRAAFLHVMGDLLGSVAALVAGCVIYFGGPTMVDPLLSMLVGGLILYSTLGVLRESTHVLMDSVPPGVDYPRLGEVLARVPGVAAVHDLHVWAMVPGKYAMSAHLLINELDRWPAILFEARRQLKQQFGIDHVTLQPEWRRARNPVVAVRVMSSPGE